MDCMLWDGSRNHAITPRDRERAGREASFCVPHCETSRSMLSKAVPVPEPAHVRGGRAEGSAARAEGSAARTEGSRGDLHMTTGRTGMTVCVAVCG